jgi:predicted dehydrogenase
MEKVRIGFVGVGKMGQMAHLKNYVTLDDCEVVAIAELREKTGKLVADRYGIPRVYPNHLKMLDAETLDGVVVIQNYDKHAALLPDIYPKVKHVITEKPLAIMAAAGEKLAQAARTAKCTHMVGYHKRSDPATMVAKQLVEEWRTSGRFGSLRYVRVTMPAGDWVANGFLGLLNAGDSYSGHMENEPPPNDLDEATLKQYDLFVNYYVHQINLLRHFLGEPYEITHAEKSGILLVAESRSGVCGTIEMTPYESTLAWEETILVAFQKGYIKLTLPAPMAINRAGTVEIYKDPQDGSTPERIFPTMPWVHAMRQQAINFINVCRGKIKPPCNVNEAVEDLRICRQYIQKRFGK